MIKCLTNTAIPEDLKTLIKKRINDTMSEKQQREEGLKIALDYHKKLHDELNVIKKNAKLPTEKYLPIDNSKTVNEVTEKYNKLIEEKKNEPINETKPQASTENKQGNVQTETAKPTETKPVETKQPTETFTDKEQAAIDAVKSKDFDGSIKTWTNILKDENSSVADKKQALKEIKEQLLDPKSEVAIGSQLGQKASDAIYDLENKEAPKTKSTKLPPTTENVDETITGEEGVGISHAETETVRKKFGLGDYERNNATDTELEALADAAIKKGYNPETLIHQMESGIPPTGVENFILKKYLATLESKFDKDPTDANLAPIERLVKATDKIGSLQSEAFRTRKGIVPVDDSLAGYFITEKETNLGAPLTEKQKGTVEKEYKDITEAQKKFDEKVAALEAENAKLKAEAEVKKAASTKKTTTGTKRTHEDFVKERGAIIDSIKDKLKKARGEVNVTPIPYAKELITIAPDVAKLVKNLVEEGIVKLGEVVDNIHGVLKESIPDITKNDVQDIIAGVYNEKIKTRNEISQQIFDLKTEAALVNKLDALLRGEEPKNERKKVKRNQEITALRDKIKDFGQAKIDAANEIKKAEAKAERLIKEFEKEQDKAKKEQLKAEATKQKDIIRELSKKTPEEIALQAYKSRTKTQIAKLEKDIKDGNFDTPTPKEPLKLDKEATDLKDKLIKVKNERHLRILKQQQENMSVREKAIKAVAEVANIPRTLMTIVDYSAVLRQGLIQTISHPQLVLNARIEDGRVKIGGAGVDMIKAGASQKVYDRWYFDLKESPRYDLIEKSGLGITDSSNPLLTFHEESFMSNLAEKIPIIGQTLNLPGGVKIPGTNLVKGSERSYTLFINKLRVDVFNRFADAMEERGLTFENSPEAYKQMAEYVNNSTGRGSLGKQLNKIAPLLNALFFSPRLIAARLNMLTYLAQPRFYKEVPKEVRQAYFKDMAKFVGVGMTVLALASINSGNSKDDTTVETDPRSSDFGKIRNKNTRWDIWGGFQPFIRASTQILMGERKSTNTGKIYDLSGEGPFGTSRGDVVLGFARTKLAPVPGMALDLFSKRTAIGDKILFEFGGKEKAKQITLDRYLKEHLLPLTYTGLEDAIKDQGVKALFTVGIPSIFGVGTQTFDNRKKK